MALCSDYLQAQTAWTMLQCMQYAVEHNHEVKRAELELDNYRAQKTGTAGRFLPAVDANIGAQYNFGRAIDPETNGYTDVNTFYNGYSLQASLPVFDGFSRVHALKAAKASELMGQSALQQSRSQTALSVLQAFTDVAYYEGLVKMAREKIEETTLLLPADTRARRGGPQEPCRGGSGGGAEGRSRLRTDPTAESAGICHAGTEKVDGLSVK